MKIMVFDDSPTHRAAAEAQLKGHDLTVVSTYEDAEELLVPGYGYTPDFDVVLTDLLVPASLRAQGSRELVGKEMPVGIFIGLLAAVKARAKYVAVFTDSDHHSHPASACFDFFNEKGEGNPTAFKVEDSLVLLCNTRNWVSYFDPVDLSKKVEVVTGGSSRQDAMARLLNEGKAVRAKDWASLLAHLIA